MATILRPSLDRWVRGQQGQRYRDDFASLSGRWVAQAGSLAVSGGALQAATLGDWLGNLVTNSEFTANLDGWNSADAITTRVDSVSEGIGASGGIDNWVLKSVASGNHPRPAFNVYAFPLGVVGRATARVYSPSSNASVLGAGIFLSNLTTSNETPLSEDIWETVSVESIATSSTRWVSCALNPSTIGDIGYYDAVTLYRRCAPALLAGWRSPNHVATLSHVSPAVAGDATDYVPFGYVCRYTDALNYWEVRVLPNTAGNDLQIIQVTAGVETTRAEADVDWTSDDTDELEVTCAGSTISTAYRKSGASVWTAGPSYASATQGQTSPDVGVMLYEAGVGRLSGFDVRRA